MLTIQRLVNLLIRKLETLPEKIEYTTCDVINMVCSPEELELTIDDLFMIDETMRARAIEKGIILDSMKNDQNPGLPFDTGFVIRRIPTSTLSQS